MVSKVEKSISWEELKSRLDKPPTLCDKLTTPFYRIKRFIVDLYYNLKPRKLKQLTWLIKFWFNYWSCDGNYGLTLLKWNLDNTIDTFERSPDYFVGQSHHLKQMKILSELLKREIEEDYGCWDEVNLKFIDYRNKTSSIKLQHIKAKENKEMLLKYLKNYGSFWI